MPTNPIEDGLPATLDELVGVEVLADYYTAPWGYRLGVYQNGSIEVGEAVGSEIEPSERPLATIRCPGLGNVDMTWWREGWKCGHLSDADVIRSCCDSGDVEDERQELIRRIREAMASA